MSNRKMPTAAVCAWRCWPSCGAVFAAFFARLARMQFARADYYADKAAEASSASYTITQHAARASSPTQTAWCWPGHHRVRFIPAYPAPPGTDLRETVKT